MSPPRMGQEVKTDQESKSPHRPWEGNTTLTDSYHVYGSHISNSGRTYISLCNFGLL